MKGKTHFAPLSAPPTVLQRELGRLVGEAGVDTVMSGQEAGPLMRPATPSRRRPCPDFSQQLLRLCPDRRRVRLAQDQ